MDDALNTRANSRVIGISKVKAEYHRSWDMNSFLAPQSKNNESNKVDDRDACDDRVDDRDMPKGKRSSKSRRNENKRQKLKSRGFEDTPKWETDVCYEYLLSGTCSFENKGSPCKRSHNVMAYYESKKNVTTGGCRMFEKYGYCKDGVRCMMANDHIQVNVVDMVPTLKNIDKRSENNFPEIDEATNVLSREIQNQLRNRSYFKDLSPSENRRDPAKTRDMFRDKIYVAPLTTVGNLPFRRILKDFGADITCGEMAVAQNLLNGQQSEWALVRRHKCETTFGIQIVGGDARVMRQAAELLERETDVDFIDINMGCPIDLVTKTGAGSALLERVNRLEDIVREVLTATQGRLPIGLKVRSGWAKNKPTTQNLACLVQSWRHSMPYGDALGYLSIHGRSRMARYTKYANWDFIHNCCDRVVASEALYRRHHKGAKNMLPIPVFGNGDILSYLDWEKHMEHVSEWKEQVAEVEKDMTAKGQESRFYKAFFEDNKSDTEEMDLDSLESRLTTCMIGRGALVKPWLSTEIKEKRNWDISGSERMEIVKSFVDYGLEHWGSDWTGVNRTRRFLLEWLSFACRYVPVGILDELYIPQKMNDRPPTFVGRDDRETLLASQNVTDWIKISEMFLGKVADDFTFEPKHKSNSYTMSFDELLGTTNESYEI